MIEINNVREFTKLVNSDYSNLDKLIQRKLDFIRERKHITDMTGYTYYKYFINFVYPIEKAKNRDLAMFDSGLVRTVIGSMPTNSLGSAYYSVYNLISMYERWAIRKGYNYTFDNPCDEIDFNDIYYNTGKVKKDYITKKDIFELYDKATKNSISITAQNLVALLLIRYGLEGSKWSEVRFLRWEDIDYENKVIRVTDRNADKMTNLNVIKTIEIDDDLIKVLREAKAVQGYETISKSATGDKEQYRVLHDYGYVLKSNRNKTEVLDSTGVRGRIKEIFDSADKGFIKLHTILLSKELEELIKIKEKKEYIYNTDIKNIKKKYELRDSVAGYMTLKKNYIDLTGDTEIRSERYNYN